jgi:hypothetical protein
LEKIVSLAVDDVQKIDFDSYSDDEFAIAKMGFLSTRPNAHNLIIDEDVLRESASSALNKWVVADMFMGEPTTHTKNEHIVGRIPRSQSVEFVYDDDGYLRAYVDTVISKIYAKDFCKAFEQDKNRAVSVEMKIFTDDEDDNIVQRFNIMGVTVLGKSIKPSCPESDIEFVRFSEDDADKFFAQKSDSLSQLKNFVEERKQSMAEKKTYKIDKSKEAMSTADWGDYDKAAMRDKIMEAKNRDTLVKSVYLLVEDGWKDAPSEHLKYPVMMLDGDKFVYNRNALSAALAYAKQNDETEVVNKIKAIYKKLDLDDDSERKEDKKMAEIEFSAVEIGDLWSKLWDAIDKRDWPYGIYGIYEEDNKKFAIITDRAKTLYRLDFSLTEDGLTLADEVVEVKQEFTETDNIKKFAEPENVAEYRLADCDGHDDDGHEEEMSADDMKARIAQLEKDIEDRDNIIMGQNSELETLRQFKKDVEDKEKAICVESVMTECKDYLADDAYKQLRQEGLECKFEEVDAWSNKVKACCFSVAKKVNKKEKSDVFSFAAPIEGKKRTSLWD